MIKYILMILIMLSVPVMTQNSSIEEEILEERFIVDPIVRLRVLNDVINEKTNGTVELYIDNPSLNNVNLNVDMRILLPSGVHMYGSEFDNISKTGMRYSVPPSDMRIVNIDFNAEKQKNFDMNFRVIYWPGNNENAYHLIEEVIPIKTTVKTPGFESIIVIIILMVYTRTIKKNKP